MNSWKCIHDSLDRQWKTQSENLHIEICSVSPGAIARKNHLISANLQLVVWLMDFWSLILLAHILQMELVTIWISL